MWETFSVAQRKRKKNSCVFKKIYIIFSFFASICSFFIIAMELFLSFLRLLLLIFFFFLFTKLALGLLKWKFTWVELSLLKNCFTVNISAHMYTNVACMRCETFSSVFLIFQLEFLQIHVENEMSRKEHFPLEKFLLYTNYQKITSISFFTFYKTFLLLLSPFPSRFYCLWFWLIEKIFNWKRSV